jgi:hypothetical protein
MNPSLTTPVAEEANERLEHQIAAQLRQVPEIVSADDSTEELAGRIAEFHRAGHESQTMPHVIYHGSQVLCPWPGCGFSIRGIDFQLERLADPAYRKQLMLAWYQGPGFAGRCPGCGKWVLFRLLVKECVDDPAAAGLVTLPSDWHQRAFVQTA